MSRASSVNKPGTDGVEPERLAMDMSSGHVQRGADALPRS